MPVWLRKAVLLQIHEEQRRRHGGDGGVLSPDAIDRAIARLPLIADYNDDVTLRRCCSCG